MVCSEYNSKVKYCIVMKELDRREDCIKCCKKCSDKCEDKCIRK